MHMPGLMLDLSRAHAWGKAHSTAISSTDSILNMNESDLRSDVHYLGSSENKAWKKFRPVRDLNPWPLRYWCSALPTELTSQLGAGHDGGSK